MIRFESLTICSYVCARLSCHLSSFPCLGSSSCDPSILGEPESPSLLWFMAQVEMPLIQLQFLLQRNNNAVPTNTFPGEQGLFDFDTVIDRLLYQVRELKSRRH